MKTGIFMDRMQNNRNYPLALIDTVSFIPEQIADRRRQ